MNVCLQAAEKMQIDHTKAKSERLCYAATVTKNINQKTYYMQPSGTNYRHRVPTVGDRAFPVAAARVWNSLPDLVTSAPSVAVFRSRLKTHLF